MITIMPKLANGDSPRNGRRDASSPARPDSRAADFFFRVLTILIFGDMVTHIKTTMDIADGLLARAKEQAALEGITLKSLTEEGLQMVLDERTQRKRRSIEPVIVSGGGLQPEFADGDWNKIRAAAYEGTGS